MKITTILFLACCVSIVSAGDQFEASRSLALSLDSENLHDLSALEFRRCSVLAGSSNEEQRNMQAGFLTAAAWEYKQSGALDLSLKMLDEAEAASRAAVNSGLLLRGEISTQQRKTSESEFFFTTLGESDAPADYKTAAISRLAVIGVRKNDPQSVRRYLESISSKAAIQELDRFESTRGRSPRTGGLLGMVPGLGYAYSGEYANGLRSLILNGIFIYAMTETADRDQWGAFTALSFFELTWYTGSIYGGIDAAHRFNRRREDMVVNAINSEYGYRLDLDAVPSITLKFSF